ncbi:hypothetical protein EV424DRAFT_1532532 [Suillus variegatus]|nr:hypothetical protein EV424DRAFT_1532532 [Suillus variegatus]
MKPRQGVFQFDVLENNYLMDVDKAWGEDVSIDNDEVQEDTNYDENYSMDIDDNEGEQEIRDIDMEDSNEEDLMEVNV